MTALGASGAIALVALVAASVVDARTDVDSIAADVVIVLGMAAALVTLLLVLAQC